MSNHAIVRLALAALAAAAAAACDGATTPPQAGPDADVPIRMSAALSPDAGDVLAVAPYVRASYQPNSTQAPVCAEYPAGGVMVRRVSAVWPDRTEYSVQVMYVAGEAGLRHGWLIRRLPDGRSFDASLAGDGVQVIERAGGRRGNAVMQAAPPGSAVDAAVRAAADAALHFGPCVVLTPKFDKRG